MKENLIIDNFNIRNEYHNCLNLTVKAYYINEELIDVYMYPNYIFKFKNKMVNNENVFYNEHYLIKGKELSKFRIERVLQGKVPMCLFYTKTLEEIEDITYELDISNLSVYLSKNYNEINPEYKYFLAISRKGKIGELFDLDTLEDDYRNCDIVVDFKKYKNLEINDLFNPKLMEREIGNANIPVNLSNLIIGIPIENDISMFYEEITGINGLGYQTLQFIKPDFKK